MYGGQNQTYLCQHVGVCAVLDEHSDHVRLVDADGEVERRLPLVVLLVYQRLQALALQPLQQRLHGEI